MVRKLRRGFAALCFVISITCQIPVQRKTTERQLPAGLHFSSIRSKLNGSSSSGRVLNPVVFHSNHRVQNPAARKYQPF